MRYLLSIPMMGEGLPVHPPPKGKEVDTETPILGVRLTNLTSTHARTLTVTLTSTHTRTHTAAPLDPDSRSGQIPTFDLSEIIEVIIPCLFGLCLFNISHPKRSNLRFPSGLVFSFGTDVAMVTVCSVLASTRLPKPYARAATASPIVNQ